MVQSWVLYDTIELLKVGLKQHDCKAVKARCITSEFIVTLLWKLFLLLEM